MSAIFTIFKREFFGYFRSPVAYVFLAVFLVAAVGLPWFIGGFFDSNQASLARFFDFLPWVFLFLIPAVGMRLWSEEKRSGTWELLFTLPISVSHAVVGKFLAGWAFISLALVLTVTMPITVAYLGSPDWGPVFTGYVGAILMAGAYLGICSLASAFTKNQVIAFVISLVLCLVLVLLGWSVFNELLLAISLPVGVVDALANFSFITHFDSMAKGLIRVADLVFFLALVAFCLSVNILVLER
jgi:ABC-2 type transport system permease protein